MEASQPLSSLEKAYLELKEDGRRFSTGQSQVCRSRNLLLNIINKSTFSVILGKFLFDLK